MADRDAFLTSVWVNLLFGLFFFLAFCALRPRLPISYAPRVRLERGSPHVPPTLPSGFFAWIKPLIQIDEMHLTASAGLDATMYLRFLYLSWQLLAAASVVGCGVVLPVNVYYDNLYYAEHADGSITMADPTVSCSPASLQSDNISCYNTPQNPDN